MASALRKGVDMTIAIIFIAAAVAALAVRASQRARNERRRAGFRHVAQKRARKRRTEYLF